MNTFISISTALVLVGLLFATTDPFMYFMPSAAAMALLFVSATCVVVFAGFVMREKGGDEREAAHRSNAGRTGYLAGLAILTVALVVQGLAHDIDGWIPLTLGVMVVAKLVARWYGDSYQ